VVKQEPLYTTGVKANYYNHYVLRFFCSTVDWKQGLACARQVLLTHLSFIEVFLQEAKQNKKLSKNDHSKHFFGAKMKIKFEEELLDYLVIFLFNTVLPSKHSIQIP
jgi:hypothetical protein